MMTSWAHKNIPPLKSYLSISLTLFLIKNAAIVPRAFSKKTYFIIIFLLIQELYVDQSSLNFFGLSTEKYSFDARFNKIGIVFF